MTTETETPETSPADAGTPAPDAGAADASVEQVRKVYAKDLREKDRVHTVFRVGQKARITARSGKVFLSAVLTDKTGELDARGFDKVDELDAAFATGDFVLVEGHVITFHGKPQVVLERAERLDPEPLDPKEFEPPPAPAPEAAAPRADKPAEGKAAEAGKAAEGEAPQRGGGRHLGQVRELLLERVGDPYVKSLLTAMLDDEALSGPLSNAPAHKGVHHSHRGGLAEYTLGVLRLVLRVAEHYPQADRDLLLAGAFLGNALRGHAAAPDRGWEPSDAGRLVGAGVLAAQKIREKTLGITAFPALLEQHLTHLALTYAGDAGVKAATLEAHVLQSLEAMESRTHAWLEAMSRDGGERWTPELRSFERALYKGPAPTQRGRAPVEGGRKGGGGQPKGDRPARKPRPEKREKPQGGGEGGGTPAAQAEGASAQPERRERPPRKDGPPREPREHREPRERVQAPKELTFKPFSLLVPKPEGGNGEGGAQS